MRVPVMRTAASALAAAAAAAATAAIVASLLLHPATARAAPGVRDDARLQHAVETARRRYLATQPFRRFDVAVLLRERDGSWRRAAVGGERLAYPASCVKLGFLVAAVHWCAQQGRAPDCLDGFVRPMIVDSNDFAAGEVVDRVSGAANREIPDGAAIDEAAFADWLRARGYVQRVLAGHGVLGEQRLLNKTYPTNSGAEPRGFEQLARARYGRNAMSPLLAAELMRGIVEGRIEPQATSYMRGLLRRERFDVNGSFAAGLPPGAIVENKVGYAYDTLEDIAWFRLPNGREGILAAFSDGWDQGEPQPWDMLRFSGFTERLLGQLALERGDPWSRTRALGARGLAVRAPVAGRYELALWYATDRRPGAGFSVEFHGAGEPQRRTFDPAHWGERWLPLGTVALREAQMLRIVARRDGGTGAPRRAPPGLRVRMALVPDDGAAPQDRSPP